MTADYLMRLTSGEVVTVPVRREGPCVVARLVREGVPNESTSTKPRAAVLRAADMAGLLGEVAGLEKALGRARIGTDS